jgi:nitrogen fixation/metabolism regulation signal transduction histidine kinase
VRLRRRFVVYLAVVHLLMAASAVFLLRQDRVWLIAVELVFALSLAWGLALLGRLSGTRAFVQQSTQLLDAGEVTTRFVEVGHPEIDELIHVYNRMVDRLRDERVRLQEQQYFLGRLLDASPSGVVTMDLDGRVSSVNPAAERTLMRSTEELKGTVLGAAASPLAQALDRLSVGESTVVALQGGRRVKCQRGAFLDRGFERSFFVIEELTEELRQSEKAAYEKLIRMMSHEVNNSVGAARSLVESSMALGAQLPASARADLESALRIAIERMERLNVFMRGFADVVRIPAPRPQLCDVDALVDGVVRLVRAHADASRITWRWERDQPIGRARMDPAQMEQALLNDLKNAVEAVQPAGTITVRLGRNDGRGIIEIEDSGPGIPDAIRVRLFTPFFTTKQNGQGIGLTMIQEILSGHRFEYSLEGPPGGPTRFRIVFPAEAS